MSTLAVQTGEQFKPSGTEEALKTLELGLVFEIGLVLFVIFIPWRILSKPVKLPHRNPLLPSTTIAWASRV